MCLIQIDGAQNTSCMCTCTELLIQVLEQKNASVFFVIFLLGGK